MINHHNGKYNIKHRFNPYQDSIKETGYEIITARKIQAGEQLFNSYNRCNVCSDYYDWFGTPEMFLHYGFVEPLPHSYLFDFARIKFDLDWKDGNEMTGEVVVNFLVPPSERGVNMLQGELARLESFSTMYRQMNHHDAGIPESEWDSLWQYYDALHTALSYAVESNETRVDDVWKLDDDWWVKDGTIKAADDDHWVRPTPRDEL